MPTSLVGRAYCFVDRLGLANIHSDDLYEEASSGHVVCQNHLEEYAKVSQKKQVIFNSWKPNESPVKQAIDNALTDQYTNEMILLNAYFDRGLPDGWVESTLEAKRLLVSAARQLVVRKQRDDIKKITPPTKSSGFKEAEDLAQFFHEAYERLAPTYSYETRPQSKAPWSAIPAENKLLMIAVAAEVLQKLNGETKHE